MLTLVLAESSVERIPQEVVNHPSVLSHARRKRKNPSLLILDRSYHHSALKSLERGGMGECPEKLGRPDIMFHVLLQVLGSPLNSEGLLRTYVHTVEDKVIEIDRGLRVPRNYDRFIGVLEQLYEQGSVPPRERPLMRIRQCTLQELVEELRPSMTVAFSTAGKPATVRDVCSLMTGTRAPLVLIGGFAHSHFAQSTAQLADHVFSIDRESLDAWVVAARVVYEYECGVDLPERRLQV